MEIHLRACSQRVKVVERLDGAHFCLTDPSVAVRVYYHEDLKRLDDTGGKCRPATAEDILSKLSKCHGETDDDDLDGLCTFRNLFKTTVVICILPKGNLDYLDRPDSFVHRIQQMMSSGDIDGGKSATVVFAPDTMPAVDSLAKIVNNLKPEKSTKKRAFVRQLREERYVPDESGVIAQNSNAAFEVVNVLKQWAREEGIPEGEESVLMNFLGNLGAIATAGDAELQGVPIEKRTKAILHRFFGSNGAGEFDMPLSKLAAGRRTPGPATQLRLGSTDLALSLPQGLIQHQQATKADGFFAAEEDFNNPHNQQPEALMTEGFSHGEGFQIGPNQASHPPTPRRGNSGQSQLIPQGSLGIWSQNKSLIHTKQRMQSGHCNAIAERAGGTVVFCRENSGFSCNPHELVSHWPSTATHGDCFGGMSTGRIEFDLVPSELVSRQPTFTQLLSQAQNRQWFASDGVHGYYNCSDSGGLARSHGLLSSLPAFREGFHHQVAHQEQHPQIQLQAKLPQSQTKPHAHYDCPSHQNHISFQPQQYRMSHSPAQYEHALASQRTRMKRNFRGIRPFQNT